MELTETHLRYLLTIYDLSHKTLDVSAAEVACAMGVSRPSVTRMLGILMERGFLVRERYGKIYLTDHGVVLARRFANRVAFIGERIPRMELDLTAEDTERMASLIAANLPERYWEDPL